MGGKSESSGTSGSSGTAGIGSYSEESISSHFHKIYYETGTHNPGTGSSFTAITALSGTNTSWNPVSTTTGMES